MSILIIRPGLLSTIQDEGRSGWQHLGIPVGGAMDLEAMWRANMLVGNPLNEAVIEMTISGLQGKVKHACMLSLSGPGVSFQINDKIYPGNQAYHLQEHDIFTVLTTKESMRFYLAAAGGFLIEPLMGSCATALQGSFGGYMGRTLQADDELRLKMNKPFCLPQAAESMAAEYSKVLRVILGPQANWFTPKIIEDFFFQDYIVQSDSNRMGLRFQGNIPLTAANQASMISDTTGLGAIQIPPDGQPVILGSDAQTMGGYPKIGYVAAIDRSRLAQLRPLQSCRFEPIAIKEAQALWRTRYRPYHNYLEEGKTYEH